MKGSEDSNGALCGRREQLLELAVEAQQRQRRAGHLERRAVLADVVTHDRQPLLLAALRGAAIEHVELADRRAAEAVDHHGDPVAGLEGQVVVDRVEKLVDDRVGGLQLVAAAARLAVDADADLHLVVADLEDRRALRRRRARRERDAHRPHLAVALLRKLQEIVEARALLGGRAAGLDHEEVAGDAAAADGVRGILHGDVVVDDEALDVDALGLRHLDRHVPVHAVALVVVDQHQDALRRAHPLDALVAELHRRGGEDAARRGGIEHAGADGHDVRRLVAAARALHDRYLVGIRPVGAVDQVVLGHVAEQVGIRERDAFEHLRYEIGGIVDELFHVWPPVVGWYYPLLAWPTGSTPTALQMSFIIVAIATMPGSGEPMLRSPVNDCRPRFATQSLVRSIASVATAVASRSTSPASASGLPTYSLILSRTGISASSSVLSPATAPPRCWMPSMAAVSLFSRSSSAMLVLSLHRAPARMKPVPQSGPEHPPPWRLMIMLIFSKNAPIELRSRWCQSFCTTRKPDASETPKSASPAAESNSEK